MKEITLDGIDLPPKSPTTPASPAPAATVPAATLPVGFLDGGFLDTAPNGKPYPRSEYVSTYAKKVAALLVPLPAAKLKSSFLGGLKKALPKATPFEAQHTAVLAMHPTAIQLVAQRKAPPVLVLLIEAIIVAVVDAPSFAAAYSFMNAVYSYMIVLSIPPLANGDAKGGDT